MSKPSQRRYDEIHSRNLERYSKEIRKLYLEIIKDIAKLSSSLKLDANSEFYFSKNKAVNRKVNELLIALSQDVYGVTVAGIDTEWGLAVDKHNELATYAFGDDLAELPDEYKLKYLTVNNKARKAFIDRKVNGLKLSDRVWNNTKQLKKELELALELTISKGKSAASSARIIQRYLNQPNRLYRRVRDEKGVLRLSKAAKAYHPGQGVYRSSYKNALRVTRNETNFSYEVSQSEKRQQQDFVVGVEIKTTPTYSPEDDKGGINCRALEGKYPKNFDWSSKWHVNCKCSSYTIIKTREELDKDTDRILAGKKPNTPSKNAVDENPASFNRYIEENQDKWKNWKTKPNFVNNK